ncbi:MAG: hypothetical protein K1W02_11475 [Muribaculaceae bacterium]
MTHRDSVGYYTQLGTKAAEAIGKSTLEVANFMEVHAEVNAAWVSTRMRSKPCYG